MKAIYSNRTIPVVFLARMSAPIETRQQHQPQPLTIPQDFGGLTLKQSAFVDHYILTGNATDSAVKAGYSLDRNSAHVIGSRLLRKVTVASEIKRRLGINICSSTETLELLSKHARADLTDVLNNDGQFDFAKAKRKRLLKKLKTKKTTRRTKDGEEIEDITHEYEIHDPQAALEKLGRFHNLWAETSSSVNVNINVDSEHLGEFLHASVADVIDVTPVDHEPSRE